MERLSVSESISKRWKTLKTEVVGGPANSRELEQHVQYLFCPWPLLSYYGLKRPMFYRGS